MRFAESAEQRGFATSLGDLLAASDVPTVVRAWSHGDYAPGRKLWSRLAELGVTAIGMPEAHGGFGAHPVDLVIAFEQLGRFAVPGPWVESVAVLPVLLVGTAAADRLDAIASGEAIATVALPPRVPSALDGAAADAIFVVDASSLHRATVSGEQRSVDRARRLAEVAAGPRIATVDTQRALDLGALATAAQTLGAGRAVLDMATAYASQRVQFGRPIGSFQAVKHLLADALVGLDLARPLLLGAAVALAGDDPTFGRDVSAAKVACTDAAYRSSRAALQVHGAIGYTSEYDLALWLTKIRALTSAWGTQAEHRARVLAAIR
jgi:alkylation response protein AidB-like acyl-CoA dehydrogenase